MKDKRFLELVNLYLDGEISEAETTELEGEIRSSARRMDQYRRYCRMQKACMILAKESREHVAASEQTVIRLPEARRAWLWGQWWRGGVYGGTAAIAATIILVISMSGPAHVAETPGSDPAEAIRSVQIPLNEFSQPVATTAPRLASITDQWSALTRIEASTFQTSLTSAPRTPEFSGTPAFTDWPAPAMFQAQGPLEFRYRTDGFSGARVLHGQPREESEAEFVTFPFAR